MALCLRWVLCSVAQRCLAVVCALRGICMNEHVASLGCLCVSLDCDDVCPRFCGRSKMTASAAARLYPTRTQTCVANRKRAKTTAKSLPADHGSCQTRAHYRTLGLPATPLHGSRPSCRRWPPTDHTRCHDPPSLHCAPRPHEPLVVWT